MGITLQTDIRDIFGSAKDGTTVLCGVVSSEKAKLNSFHEKGCHPSTPKRLPFLGSCGLEIEFSIP